MEFYIWDKQEPLMGMSANTLLSSRLDFLYEAVIVIHKIGNKEDIVMIETANNLRETYDIDSQDPEAIGFIVCVVLMQEDQENAMKLFNEMKEDNNKANQIYDTNDNLEEYARLLADILEMQSYKTKPFVPLKGSYEDPECSIIDLSDVNPDITDKQLTVVLHHVFVSEVSDLTELKCLSEIADELNALADKLDQYSMENDLDMIDVTLTKYNLLKSSISDSCDATIKINAKAIYNYESNIIIDCVNGQTVIIDKSVFKSIKNNALEYQKHNPETSQKYKVHYKTVDIELDECCNELKERNNSVFIVSI